jgi:hypothetical protein
VSAFLKPYRRRFSAGDTMKTMINVTARKTTTAGSRAHGVFAGSREDIKRRGKDLVQFSYNTRSNTNNTAKPLSASNGKSRSRGMAVSNGKSRSVGMT